MDRSIDYLEQSVFLRYAVAVIAVLAALGFRMSLDPVLGTHAPYLPFALAILVASRYGGRGPGVAATALSVLLVDWFFIEPRGSLFMVDRAAGAGLALLFLVGVLISLFVGRLRESLISAARGESSPAAGTEFPPASTDRGKSGATGAKGFNIAGLRQKPHLAWLVSAALIVVIEGALFAASWSRLSDREAWTIHTHQVIENVDSLFSALQDAETGQRGYLLTGQNLYLTPYTQAVQGIANQIEVLRELTSDNQREQLHVKELRALSAARLAELRETLELRNARGGAAALQVVSAGHGERIMDEIRVLIAAMRAEEFSLLGQRQEKRAAEGRGMRLIIFSGGGLLLIMLLAGSRAINRNIAWRKRSEEALRDSETQFRTLANAIPQLCWMANADGWITWYNDRWYEYTGTTPQQMEGWGWQSVHDAVELPKVLERWKASIATGKPFDMVFPLRGADGVFRPFLTRVMPVFDQDGKVVRWFGTNTDISEQRKIEEALRQSLERLERVLEVETVGVMFWDLNTGCMVDANDTFFKLMGYSRSQVEARELTWQKLTPPEYLDVSRAEVEKFLATGRVGPYEKEYFRSDGTRQWLLFAGSSLGNNQCVEFCVDISGRKKAEEERRKSEARFRRLYDAGMLGVIFWNIDGAIIDANDKFLEMAGYDRDDLAAGRIDWLGMTPPEYRHLDEASMKELKASGVNRAPFEKEYIRKDGSRIPVIVAGAMLDDARFDGVAFVLDISERKRAEMHLHESEERLEFATTASGIGVWSWTPGTNDVMVSGNWRRLFGVSPDVAVTLETWRDALHPDDRARAVSELNLAAEQRRDFDVEYRVVWPDGTVRWLTDRGRASYDETGCAIGMAGVSVDISELKRAQDEVRRQILLVNLSHDAILVMDANRVIRAWNAGAAEMYGWAEAEALGNVTHEFLRTRSAIPNTEVDRILAHEGRWDGEFVHTRRDGREIAVESRQVLVRDASGLPVGILEINRDITDRKRAEEALRQLNVGLERRVRDRTAQLESANAELEAFAYSVSHDLRAPLRSVDGFAKILLRDYRDKLDEKAANYMDRMHAACGRMSELIDDLLVLSRVTRAEFNRERVDLSQIAAAVLAELQNREPQRRVGVEIEPHLEADADPRLIRVALDNLLGNAWKFTGKTGAPAIAFGAAQVNGERAYFVKDNGVGFDMAHAGQLFAPFQRLHRADEFEGSGIGLATVQRVIRRHEGRVWAESQPGKGTILYFTLGNN